MAGSTFNKMKAPMRYNRLGAAGVQVSEFSFGCMTFSDQGAKGAAGNVSGEAAFDMMRVCFEHGVNFFDNAEAYGGAGASERIMGEAIRTGMQRGVWERKDLVISTKLYIGSVLNRGRNKNPNVMGLSRKHLTEGLL
eukprot:gene9968-20821_t